MDLSLVYSYPRAVILSLLVVFGLAYVGIRGRDRGLKTLHIAYFYVMPPIILLAGFVTPDLHRPPKFLMDATSKGQVLAGQAVLVLTLTATYAVVGFILGIASFKNVWIPLSYVLSGWIWFVLGSFLAGWQFAVNGLLVWYATPVLLCGAITVLQTIQVGRKLYDQLPYGHKTEG